MGCPRSFSLSGGMGAALLSKPELIHDILYMLPESCCSCKIHSHVIKVFTLLTTIIFFPQILTALRRNLDTPVTCKIRLLSSSRDTVELAQQIEKTRVSALPVHGRYSPLLQYLYLKR